jgi:hypothetical protein
MRVERNNVINRLVDGGLRSAEASLQAFEKNAHKAIKGMRARQRVTQNQVEELLASVRSADLVRSARNAEHEWQEAAGELGANLSQRIAGWQTGFLNACGIASRSQIQAIAEEVSRISRKVNRVARAQGSERPASGNGHSTKGALSNGRS